MKYCLKDLKIFGIIKSFSKRTKSIKIFLHCIFNDIRKIWHVKRGERNGCTENCLSSRKRTSFFCAIAGGLKIYNAKRDSNSIFRANVLPIFFYSLDFFFSHFFCVKTKEVTYTLYTQRKWQTISISGYCL